MRLAVQVVVGVLITLDRVRLLLLTLLIDEAQTGRGGLIGQPVRSRLILGLSVVRSGLPAVC